MLAVFCSTQLKSVPVTSDTKLTVVKAVPPQMVSAVIAVMVGIGFTVMMKVCSGPVQVTPPLVKVGVNVMVAVTCAVPELIAVKAGTLPVPLAPNPMLVLSLVQV